MEDKEESRRLMEEEQKDYQKVKTRIED